MANNKSQTNKTANAKKFTPFGYVNDFRNILCAIITALVAIGIAFGIRTINNSGVNHRLTVTAGFIYDGDESTPYSANFIRAARQLEDIFGEKLTIIEKYNVPYESAGEVIADLVSDGCNIIFTNSYGYGETAKNMALKYPDVQFCAATCDNANTGTTAANYHNFMGEIYQGRYISGIAAGAKLNEMIQNGTITRDEAVLGFVAAYPCAEVISGYTAFLLGARSQCPSAVMRVKYINTWTSYTLEKEAARQLIDEGCVIISHHSNTIGSAIACENADMPYPVYHVGYNQDMIGIAPTSALISCRIDWLPYYTSAIKSVFARQPIEKNISGRINGNDASGGFKEGWVKLLELNSAAASEDTRTILGKAVEDMENGKTHVFSGNYKGVSFSDPNDVIDLSTEFIENRDSSAPTFHYVLNDVIIIDDE